LSVAIVLSLLLSLTTTPCMCAHLLGNMRARAGSLVDRFLEFMERGFKAMLDFYAHTLRAALAHPRLVISILGATVALNIYLFIVIPKGFFPQQDTGVIQGVLRADQDVSFEAMESRLRQALAIVGKDPAVESFGGFTNGGGGFGGGNTARLDIDLKPLSQRHGMTSDEVIARLRGALSKLTGARLFLQVQQDIRAGGRQGNAEYQYTLLGDNLEELNTWAPKIAEALKHVPQLADVNSSQQNSGLDIRLNVDRPTAARLGVNLTALDNTLYDAFGQRQVSTIYEDKNQYHVVMEVAPQFWQNPSTLRDIWVSTSGGALSGTQATAAAIGDFSSAASRTARGATSSGGGGAPTGTTGGATRARPATAAPPPAASSSSSRTASGVTAAAQAAARAAAQASAQASLSAAQATGGGGAGAGGATSGATSSTTSAASLAAQNAHLNQLTNSGR